MTPAVFPFTALAEHLQYVTGRPVTAGELAALLELDRRTVVRWRHDDRVPARHVDRIADALLEHPALIWPRYHSAVTARGALSERCAA